MNSTEYEEPAEEEEWRILVRSQSRENANEKTEYFFHEAGILDGKESDHGMKQNNAADRQIFPITIGILYDVDMKSSTC